MSMKQQSPSSSIDLISMVQDKALINIFDEQAEVFKQNYPKLTTLSPLNPQDIEKGYDSQSCNRFKKSKAIRKKHAVGPKMNFNKKRVNVYIESLENKNFQLETENQKLKRLNKLNVAYIKKLNDSSQIINGYFINRQRMLQKLQHLIEEDRQDNSDEILRQCISLKIKQGAFGKERIKAINYFFKEMVEMLLPQSQKYLSEAAQHQTDMFMADLLQQQNSMNDQQKNLIDEKVYKTFEKFASLGFNRQSLVNMSQQRQNILTKKRQFNQKLLEMYSNKCKLIEKARQIEEIFERFYQFLTPSQIGKFVCYIEKIKFEKENSIFNTISQAYPESLQTHRYTYHLPSNDEQMNKEDDQNNKQR